MKPILLVISVLALAGSIGVRPGQASETCIASVFSEGYGRPMADGLRHRTSDLLVAHKTRPFGTPVRVTVVATGASVNPQTTGQVMGVPLLPGWSITVTCTGSGQSWRFFAY